MAHTAHTPCANLGIDRQVVRPVIRIQNAAVMAVCALAIHEEIAAAVRARVTERYRLERFWAISPRLTRL
jgi:hypothetical protein